MESVNSIIHAMPEINNLIAGEGEADKKDHSERNVEYTEVSNKSMNPSSSSRHFFLSCFVIMSVVLIIYQTFITFVTELVKNESVLNILHAYLETREASNNSIVKSWPENFKCQISTDEINCATVR